MRVQLGKIGDVKQGVVLNRVKAREGESGEWYKVLTIGKLLDVEEGIETEQDSMLCVSASKVSSLKLAKAGMILIGLTSFHKAVVLTKEQEGMIIPSNFLCLEFPGGIMDAHYFAWYFNESPNNKELKESVINGEGKIKVLSIQQIRSMMVEVPDLVSQMSIGSLYSLQIEKSRVWKKILRYEMKVLTQRMNGLCTGVRREEKTKDSSILEFLYKQSAAIEASMQIYEKELQLFHI